MSLFQVQTGTLVLVCSDVHLAKQWWIKMFDCKEVKVPDYWDNPLPSDVALELPGDDEPTILLNDEAEARRAGFQRENEHPILFCRKLGRTRENLARDGASPGPIQESGAKFFEIRDPCGTVIALNAWAGTNEGAGSVGLSSIFDRQDMYRALNSPESYPSVADPKAMGSGELALQSLDVTFA